MGFAAESVAEAIAQAASATARRWRPGGVFELARGSDCSACDCEFAAQLLRLGVRTTTIDAKVPKAFPVVAVPLPGN